MLKTLPFLMASLVSSSVLAQGSKEKSVNIRIQQAPVFVLSLVEKVNLVDIEVMMRPTQFINLGLVGAAYHEQKNDYEFRSYNLGLRIDFVFSGVGGFSDAFYLSNAVMSGKWQSEERVVDAGQGECVLLYKAQGGNVVAGGTFGYQWFWNNGYNINLGAGIVKARPVGVKSERQSSCPTQPELEREHGLFQKPWIDVGLGYAF